MLFRSASSRRWPSCCPASCYAGRYPVGRPCGCQKDVRTLVVGYGYHGLFKLVSPASIRRTWRLWSRLASRPATTQLKSKLATRMESRIQFYSPAGSSTAYDDINLIWDRHLESKSRVTVSMVLKQSNCAWLVIDCGCLLL